LIPGQMVIFNRPFFGRLFFIVVAVRHYAGYAVLMGDFFGFDKNELRVLARLDTPKKIQDFLDKMPINMERHGDTCMSPRQVLKRKTAHCAEAALLAAVALWYHGQKPLLMDLRATNKDQDHVVALYRSGGFWGAISKTNHAVLRYREPVYKTVRELALSYFHEYFINDGKKTLRSFSNPFNLSKIKDRSWMVSAEDLWELIYDLDCSPHQKIVSPKQIRNLRKADKIEIKAGKLVQ